VHTLERSLRSDAAPNKFPNSPIESRAPGLVRDHASIELVLLCCNLKLLRSDSRRIFLLPLLTFYDYCINGPLVDLVRGAQQVTLMYCKISMILAAATIVPGWHG
jgi:hypothetical protein